jgi:hypothetical protein
MSAVLARAYAATGMLGSGFSEASLRTAMSWKPDFIGVDSGSTDGGPNYLATGTSMFGAASVARDLRLLLGAARQANIPLIIGSAGTGGGDRNLAWTREILMRVAAELGLGFRLATIHAEQDPSALHSAWIDGRVAALEAAPQVDADDLHDFATIVAMMGTEPIAAALAQGADVVLAGRASDAAIFAAIPLQKGVEPGIAWHAAKVLECGAAAVTHRTHPDGMFVELERDAFTIFPPKPEFRCTPQSIAAHALYENADPFALTEPPGTVRLEASRYEAVDDRTVRVAGTTFDEAPSYTVKLEAARLRGYRSLFLGGVRDPYVLRQLDRWLGEVEATARKRASASFPDAPFDLVIRRYGQNGVLGQREPQPFEAHEVLLAFEVVAATQDVARGIADDVRHVALHHPIPEWHGLITVLAHPHSPAVIDQGPVYEFGLHHVLHVDDPLAPFAIHIESVAP